MDVLEDQLYKHKNQYWLAAKYGGFTVPAGFSPYSATNGTTTLPETSWYTTTDTLLVDSTSLTYSTDNGANAAGGIDKRPDNYFPGNRPDALKIGLTQAFAKISAETTSVNSTALAYLSPNEASSGSLNYSASYDPTNWTGTLSASTVSYASDGTPSLTAVWDARDLLSNTSVSSRKIVTCCTSANAALPFTYTSLSAATLHSRTNLSSFANVPGVPAGSQSTAKFIAYLRGDRSQEISNGGAYRNRSYLLGDIVNSKLTVVGTPSSSYYDTTNPGYSSFKRSQASRKTVVYAGANDGMLHAIDGSSGQSRSGSELFAYIPSFLYGDSSTAADRGLAALGNASYSHRYFVDATPVAFDVDLQRAGTPTAAGTQDWRTLLIGGLGKGGKGYYAIDITDPTAWTTATAVAGKVLWEFTAATMGYSFGDARIVKTAKYGWTTILTSGYNNSDGKGYIYFVDPKTGALLETVATSEGSTSAPLNLAYVTAFVPDQTDYTATALYAADLQGNVWRVDLTPSSGNYDAPTLIAKLTDSAGAVQPVTTAVRVMIDPATAKRYLLVGTGQLLNDNDISSTQRQTFYAIADGTSSAFYTSATLPTGVSFPITRSQLNANTNLSVGIGSSPTSPMGWYYDLGSGSGSIAERITVAPAVNNGIVGVALNLPDGDACNPSGSSRVMAVSFTNGKSVLTDSSGGAIALTSSVTGITSELAFKNIGGKIRLISGRSSGAVTNLPGTFSASGGLRRLNWREVPTVQ